MKHTYDNPEPSQIIKASILNTVSDSGAVDALQVRTINVFGVRALRGVGEDLSGVGIAENAAPLLDGLIVVLGPQSGVCGAVVDLHLGSAASVSRVHCVHGLSPLLGGLDNLALSAVGVPSIDTVGEETSGRHARVDNNCLEKIRVSRCENVLQDVLITYSRYFRN